MNHISLNKNDRPRSHAKSRTVLQKKKIDLIENMFATLKCKLLSNWSTSVVCTLVIILKKSV